MQPHRPPTDPVARDLIRAARASASGRSVTRRSLLGATLPRRRRHRARRLRAPGPAGGGGVAALKLPTDVSDTDKVVRWANWTAYLDYDEDTKKYPTLEAFIKKTGIKASYTEDIDDNDSYFNKIAPQLRAEAGHRPRHLHLHRLDGQPGHPRPARPAARADPDAARRQPARQPSRTCRSTPAGSTRSPGRAGSPASATTSQGRPRPEVARRPLVRRPQGQDRRAERVPRHRSG